MPLKYAPVIRVCFAVGTLMWCGAQAAEQKPSLIGASRSEVLARFGEPKSQIVVGNRQVLFFSGERIVIRDDRVVEAEEIAVEASPAPVAEKPAFPVGNSDVAPVSAAPAGDTVPSATSSGSPQSQESSSHPTRAVPEVMIKSVRPPSRVAVPAPSVPPQQAPAAKPVPVPPELGRTAAPQVQTLAATSAPADTAVPPPPAKESGLENAAAPAGPESEPAPTGQPDKPEVPAPTSPVVAQPPGASVTPLSASQSGAGHRVITSTEAAEDTADVVSRAFTAQTYVIAAILIGGGIGYLAWRRRQRRLELAATAVSYEPFAPAAVAHGADVRFTAEFLNQLDRNRFDELVAAYYNKTGVVATRGGAGPTTPVQIRISWKGEQRPFACVRCIAHPEGLIDAKPVQELCDAIAAEDIRRGYVVTTGRFGVPARDLAEEKHVTLLPGELFLEKLNALPEAARAELLKAVTSMEPPASGVAA